MKKFLLLMRDEDGFLDYTYARGDTHEAAVTSVLNNGTRSKPFEVIEVENLWFVKASYTFDQAK